ncbi:hypothetical protein L596_026906 [Steinernema carpocapsae]|uniref:Uncharacterized protein n=1 Tax=Steinernema carpocapsae TaxID=34508 RepID=A0A4U5M2T5_STECR|nr:hypothetical protein L596_026906 [Steinernema carpocapsae]
MESYRRRRGFSDLVIIHCHEGVSQRRLGVNESKVYSLQADNTIVLYLLMLNECDLPILQLVRFLFTSLLTLLWVSMPEPFFTTSAKLSHNVLFLKIFKLRNHKIVLFPWVM